MFAGPSGPIHAEILASFSAGVAAAGTMKRRSNTTLLPSAIMTSLLSAALSLQSVFWGEATPHRAFRHHARLHELPQVIGPARLLAHP